MAKGKIGERSVINIDGGRQTGRTTRMLKEALEHTSGGATAHVVVNTTRSRERMLKQAHKLAEEMGAPELAHQLAFITPDTRETALRGRLLPSAEFWDHFAVETVHEDRLRLKDQVYRLMEDVALLKNQLRETRDEALKLRLELDVKVK